MTIGFRASSSGDLHNPGATTTITKPTGTTSTDVLLAVFGCGRVSGTNSVTAPSGWTRVGSGQGSVIGPGGTITQDVFWALGSVASLGFTNGAGTAVDQGWVCLAFTGVDTTTPIDVTGTTVSSTSTNTVSAGSITIATDQAWHLVAANDWMGGNLTATSFTRVQNTSTNESAAGLYNTTPKSTGATGAVTVTSSASTSGQSLLALPFALRPASGGTVAMAGSSAGVGTASGVGASTSVTAGSAAGVGVASGVGAATKATTGSSSGTGSASAVGASTAATVGTSAGVGSATAVGASTTALAGTSAGVGSASGVGAATKTTVGSASGVANVSGVGASTATMAGSAAGAGTATGVSPGAPTTYPFFFNRFVRARR